MHLNDKELLELDSEAHSHLQNCAECMLRFQNRQAIRNLLKSMPLVSSSEDQWPKLEMKFLKETSHGNIIREKRKAIFWKRVSYSLAASLSTIAIGSLIYFRSLDPVPTEYNQLMNVIEENNLLQQRLRKLQSLQQVVSIDLVQLNSQLLKMDSAIQRAYQDKVSVQMKKSLWERRRKILEQMAAPDFDLKVKKKIRI